MVPIDPHAASPVLSWPSHGEPNARFDENRVVRLAHFGAQTARREHSGHASLGARRRALALHPIHALHGGHLSGAAAALSWRVPRPVPEFWPPSAVPIDLPDAAAPADTAWLLQAACVAAADWNGERLPRGWERLRVSIALPDACLRAGSLREAASTALSETALRPDLLEICLDEASIRDEAAETLLALSALRDLGTGLAVDCFEGGVEGLRALRRVPITSVKLAPPLVRDVPLQRDSRTTVAAIVKFAHAQDTMVLALGVETETQRDILADLGCDEAQGALLGGPIGASHFAAALLAET